MNEQNRIGRRKFLKIVGAGVIVSATGGYYLLRRKPRDLFERIHGSLSDILDDNPSLGKIGRTYQATPQSVVVAVRNRHNYAVMQDRLVDSYKRTTERLGDMQAKFEAYIKTEKDEAKKLAMSETIRDLARRSLANVEKMQQLEREVTHYQKRVYTLLNNLVRETDGCILIGSEGTKTGEIHFESINNISVDKSGNLMGDTQTLNSLFNYGAERVIKTVHPARVRLFGLEDEILHAEGEALLKSENKDEKRYNRLNIQRNRVAAEGICNALRGTQSSVGILVFGASHFTTINPTILNYLEQQGQSYIEVVPKGLD